MKTSAIVDLAAEAKDLNKNVAGIKETMMSAILETTTSIYNKFFKKNIGKGRRFSMFL